MSRPRWGHLLQAAAVIACMTIVALAPGRTSGAGGSPAANLDNTPPRWDVPYCELGYQGQPLQAFQQNSSAPTICRDHGIQYDDPHAAAITRQGGDGTGLELRLRGGPQDAYPNVLFRRLLSDYPTAARATAYVLDLWFQLPASFNQQQAASGVQAVEFAIQVWRPETVDGRWRRYDWEVQLDNVPDPGQAGPEWRMNFPGTVAAGFTDNHWVPISVTPIPGILADGWHHLVLRAAIVSGQPTFAGGWGMYYDGFAVDDVEYPIGKTVQPDILTREQSRGLRTPAALVHVQLDGTNQIDNTPNGYAVQLDAVSLTFLTKSPWTEACPKSNDAASRLFGGQTSAWTPLQPPFNNGWKYNPDAKSPPDVLPVLNGRIPVNYQADFSDGTSGPAHLYTMGPDRIPYAQSATLWCLSTTQ